MSSTERINEAFEKALQENVFPGASVLVARGEEILFKNIYGSSTLLPSPEPLLENTFFDIASLTKPVVGASLTHLAVKEKGLNLNTTLGKFFEIFDEEDDKKKITLRHLLKHTSGLPAWKQYYKDIAIKEPTKLGTHEALNEYLKLIAQDPLEKPIAYQRIYTDMGFIILGAVLEKIWDQSLDKAFDEKIARPLNLEKTFFRGITPRGELMALPDDITRFAATEKTEWRGRLIRGEVHDDNAYALGGVAAHAGLFSTTEDLHCFLLEVEKGLLGKSSLFAEDLSVEFLGPQTKTKMGWDTPSPQGSQAGKYFSKHSIGHLGYTGCSFWADLENNFHIILLTNRVHPTSTNEKIKSFRPYIHDLIIEELKLNS